MSAVTLNTSEPSTIHLFEHLTLAFLYRDKLGHSVDDATKNFTKTGKVDWKAAYENLWQTSEEFDKLK